MTIWRKYVSYWRSPQGQERRRGIMSRMGIRCANCDNLENLQISHLAFDPLFNETDPDLILLCTDCTGDFYEECFLLTKVGRSVRMKSR